MYTKTQKSQIRTLLVVLIPFIWVSKSLEIPLNQPEAPYIRDEYPSETVTTHPPNTEIWSKTLTGAIAFSNETTILSFDSTNSISDIRIFDPASGGVCRLISQLRQGFYSFSFRAKTPLACSQGIISRIGSLGQILFIDPLTGQYRYITKKFGYSKMLAILREPGSVARSLVGVSAPGVDIVVTKTYTPLKRGSFDGFRVYSKASGANGQYPSYFYSLVSDAEPETFIKAENSTLTLERTDWLFKDTSPKTRFDKIQAVNFIPDLGSWNSKEAQFIFGEDQGRKVCLFGIVDLYRYFQGTESFFKMYSGRRNDQAFSCDHGGRYQGLVMKNWFPSFYYSIHPQTGEMRVCKGLPKELARIKEPKQFGSSCKSSKQPRLVLRKNEYYSAVDIQKIRRGAILAVVSVRTKGDGTSLRQAVVDFGLGLRASEFDLDQYFYTVNSDGVKRIRKRFGAGEQISISSVTSISSFGKNSGR